MRRKATVFVIFVLVMTGTFVGCNRYSLKADPRAQDALMALKKLDAKTESGLDRRDYSAALGDANFAVKLFVESDKAKLAPEFSNALRETMKWYTAASELWDRHIETDQPYGYCEIVGSSTAIEQAAFRSGAEPLCVSSYPELIATTTEKPAERELRIIIYELAMQEAWKRAAFALKNAEHSFNGEPLEKADATLFKIDRKTEGEYLVREAKRVLFGSP